MKKEKENVRKKFIKDWGEELAKKFEEAAEKHRNGINDREIGDYFKWALLICIGYQCLEKPEYRKYHGIGRLNWRKMKKWIRDNAELEIYRGDFDYLAWAAGKYDYFLKNKRN